MTDTLALMAAGFMHAFSPINLLAMLASTIVGMVGGRDYDADLMNLYL